MKANAEATRAVLTGVLVLATVIPSRAAWAESSCSGDQAGCSSEGSGSKAAIAFGAAAIGAALGAARAQVANAGKRSCQALFRPAHYFGPEFTFTNAEMMEEGLKNPHAYDTYLNPVKKQKWKELVLRILQECRKTRECSGERVRDKHDEAHRITFKDGYNFTVGVDTLVLEVTAHRETHEGFDADRMQKYVFDLAAEVGLKPHEWAGSGHIHVSRRVFREDSTRFRNFLVDFQNRPEIIMGVFGADPNNAATLSALKPAQREAFAKILTEFNPKVNDINDFVKVLHERVFTETFAPEADDANYYQAFNLTRMGKIDDYATLELRGFRPQESAHVYKLQTQLIDRWIEKTGDQKRSIPYLKKAGIDFKPQEIVDSFAQLLKDLDLSYDEYRVLLPKELRDLAPNKRPSGVPYRLR